MRHTEQMAAHRYVPASFGGLGITATDDGVASVEFLSFDQPRTQTESTGDKADAIADRAAEQIAEYLSGQRRRFELPLDWKELASLRLQVLQTLYETVDYGVTVTYQQLAERCGHPSAARVVGQIMGSNPIPVIVPCHRVTASGGELGGFGGGLETKRWLLELEGSLPPRLPF
jgi:methylated-DNA-[protein]-cysteine S-methyltransferase